METNTLTSDLTEQELLEAVILWNKNQFYRAVNDNRFRDAERYLENINKLES